MIIECTPGLDVVNVIYYCELSWNINPDCLKMISSTENRGKEKGKSNP